ncbi:MAG TPA: polysaccharide biosynthesis/export family protein [Sedimentisphaerales bacterium]|nr:polysaccharide biosynthesis/export family protein [Sedimentisphaerales bacterium]
MQEPKLCIRYSEFGLACVGVWWLLFLPGCGGPLSGPDELAGFAKAGPARSEADFQDATGIKSHAGPYRVMSGDILEFQMPAVLRVISSDLPDWLKPVTGHNYIEPYLVRVTPEGTITLPIVSQIPAGGRTLAEIEALVIDAYYPKYVVNRPMVVCEVKKYQSENERVFAVLGLVNKSGVFPYPPDLQYNLMEALAFAEGLDMVADPRYVKIYRQDSNGQVVAATFGVDEKSLADAYGVVVKPGDLIYVDHTFRTRVNRFMSDVFHITFGVGAGYTYQ